MFETWTYAAVFSAAALNDVVSVFWNRSVNLNRPIIGAGMSAVIEMMHLIVLIPAVQNFWLAAPAVLGSAVGTYAGMRAWPKKDPIPEARVISCPCTTKHQ